MELTDNDYLANLFSSKSNIAREHPNQKILAIVCRKAKMTLEDSVNYVSIKEKDGIHYLWRGVTEIILENNDLGFTDNEFYFVTEEEYKEAHNEK